MEESGKKENGEGEDTAATDTTLHSPVTKVGACDAKTTVVVIHDENFVSTFDDCDNGRVRVERLALDYLILLVLI